MGGSQGEKSKKKKNGERIGRGGLGTGKRDEQNAERGK